MGIRRLGGFGVLAASGVFSLNSPVLAQTVPDPAAVEEVVVTARRREERLQDAPVSATVLTAQALERQGVTDMNQVALRTPGMTFNDFGDVKLAPTSLRGIVGASGSAGSDPAVGYYVDEVFLGQGAGANLDLYDIERVEVLRGPQGAFFGRNTIGGVVNITTKRPSETLEASATAAVGNYDFRRLAASVSGPIINERLLGKLALVAEQRGGTSKNDFLGRDVNTQDAWSARGQLLFEIGRSNELLLTADYRHVDQEPLAFETLRYNDRTTFAQIADLTGITRNTDPFDYRVLLDDVTRERLNGGGLAATFRTDVGGVRVTNVASYRKHDYFSRTDTDRSPLSILYDGDPESVWRWSEELRAEGSIGPVDWLTGVYYYRQRTRNFSFVEIGSDLAEVLGAPELGGLRTGSNAELDTTSKAAFASATWKASDSLDLTMGGRYTRDEKTIDYAQFDPVQLLGGTFKLAASDAWGEFTPHFNARYRFSPRVMAYATVSRGFKSGGFNDALGDANGISFGPETLWNYEVGLKSELFARRLLANLAVYRMNWSDIQLQQDNPRTQIYDPAISNAGKAHSAGVELEVIARPADGLTLQASGSFQEAEFDEGVLALPPPAPPQPLERIPYAPEYTLNVSAEQRLPLGPGEITVFAQYLARGETYLSNNNEPDAKVKPHGLLEARVGWEPEHGRWRIAVFGRNLTDEVYKERLFDLFNQDVVGQKFIILNEPRTYGLEMRADF